MEAALTSFRLYSLLGKKSDFEADRCEWAKPIILSPHTHTTSSGLLSSLKGCHVNILFNLKPCMFHFGFINVVSNGWNLA